MAGVEGHSLVSGARGRGVRQRRQRMYAAGAVCADGGDERGHAGDAFVFFEIGFVRAHVEVEHVVFYGGDAIEAEVDVDDFLRIIPRFQSRIHR